ncbi:MAG TPA: hypothetical protein VFI02_14485 [Armatimonadota bacterium]|nr:hypothetical protein [Armatimonadota bacterium]
MDASEKIRLDQLDCSLRKEADEFLVASGLGPIIAGAGFEPVGSYVMRTMTWRDLDFEREVDEPDWDDHLALGLPIAGTGWVWRLNCVDAYRDQEIENHGYYWGLRASDPSGGPTWKLDLWTGRPSEFAPALELRARWMSLLTEDRRLDILAIKEAVCSHPEYRKSMLSVHIYQAVLERRIKGVDAFLEWWRCAHGQG